ncbi:MAG: hypothetical protein TUN42_08215 [Dehalogenimonas sp.]
MNQQSKLPRGTVIGWIAFVVLSLPVIAFAIGVGISEGFNLNRLAVTAIDIATVGFASWLLGFGISRRSKPLIVLASIFILLILVTYAAAISLLIGGLNIKVF